jgi:hypothetical protein
MTLLLNQAYSQFAIPKELQLFENDPNQLVAQNQYYSVIKPKSALSTANDIVFQFAIYRFMWWALDPMAASQIWQFSLYLI